VVDANAEDRLVIEAWERQRNDGIGKTHRATIVAVAYCRDAIPMWRQLWTNVPTHITGYPENRPRGSSLISLSAPDTYLYTMLFL
jgi:hypothetical protein